MAVREYVGARYVPKFSEPQEWSKSKEYENLEIVLHEGNSYTSKKKVPSGIEISNTEYWACTGNYNVQVENAVNDVKNVQKDVNAKVDGFNATVEAGKQELQGELSGLNEQVQDGIGQLQQKTNDGIAKIEEETQKFNPDNYVMFNKDSVNRALNTLDTTDNIASTDKLYLKNGDETKTLKTNDIFDKHYLQRQKISDMSILVVLEDYGYSGNNSTIVSSLSKYIKVKNLDVLDIRGLRLSKYDYDNGETYKPGFGSTTNNKEVDDIFNKANESGYTYDSVIVMVGGFSYWKEFTNQNCEDCSTLDKWCSLLGTYVKYIANKAKTSNPLCNVFFTPNISNIPYDIGIHEDWDVILQEPRVHSDGELAIAMYVLELDGLNDDYNYIGSSINRLSSLLHCVNMQVGEAFGSGHQFHFYGLAINSLLLGFEPNISGYAKYTIKKSLNDYDSLLKHTNKSTGITNLIYEFQDNEIDTITLEPFTLSFTSSFTISPLSLNNIITNPSGSGPLFGVFSVNRETRSYFPTPVLFQCTLNHTRGYTPTALNCVFVLYANGLYIATSDNTTFNFEANDSIALSHRLETNLSIRLR